MGGRTGRGRGWICLSRNTGGCRWAHFFIDLVLFSTMVRHSKNISGNSSFRASERKAANKAHGSQSTRIGSDSFLPFGYCHLSNQPTENDAVVSGSGRIYKREVILQYLVDQKDALRDEMAAAFREESKQEALQLKREREEEEAKIEEFKKAATSGMLESKSLHNENRDGLLYTQDSKRQKVMDDTTDEHRAAHLKDASPWIPAAKPTFDAHKPYRRDTTVSHNIQLALGTGETKAPDGSLLLIKDSEVDKEDGNAKEEASLLKEDSLRESVKQRPTKKSLRIPSPFSQQPLRAKDLIPVDLRRDTTSDSTIRYLCPISLDQITTQDVVLIKPTKCILTKECYTALAEPTGKCPATNQSFNANRDVISIVKQGTAFAASGNVMSERYRPGFNV